MLCLAFAALAAPVFNAADSPLHLELSAELGFLAPLSHTVQFGKEGTNLDYVRDGGQDNLFPVFRPTAAVTWQRQRFVVLWQPLDLRTTVALDEPLDVDGVVFDPGQAIDLRYGFSFWRLSWAHQVIQRERLRLGLGLGLQIRNATIGFTSVDGSRSETNRDIGPVPLLELEIAGSFRNGIFLEAEIDGFYAPIKYLNGRGVDVVGAIADMQLRAGFKLAGPAEAFLGVRYLGGGASGTGTPDGVGDGYTENWLHFGIVTLGARLR